MEKVYENKGDSMRTANYVAKEAKGSGEVAPGQGRGSNADVVRV